MTPEEKMWRDRFITLNLVRIGGTAVVLLGLAIWYSDLAVEGGSIAFGLPMALAGLTISFGGPRWLVDHWKKSPPA